MCILCKTGPLIYAEIGMTVLSVRKHILFFREILTSQSIHNAYQASKNKIIIIIFTSCTNYLRIYIAQSVKFIALKRGPV